jgi:hypothetical protein
MRIWIKSLLTLACVTAAGYLADRLLRHEGIPGPDLLLLSDFLVGLVAASLVFVLAVDQQNKARRVEDRLRVIAEMNHHIRNALQVIAYHTWSARSEQEIASMHQAVNRITWALQEVLPQLPGAEQQHPPGKNNSSSTTSPQDKRRTPA